MENIYETFSEREKITENNVKNKSENKMASNIDNNKKLESLFSFCSDFLTETDFVAVKKSTGNFSKDFIALCLLILLA